MPRSNPEYDREYNFSVWSMAPRNQAAEGLPWLAARKSDAQIEEAIETLVMDEVPSVRDIAIRGLFRLRVGNPVVFWRLAQYAARNEVNKLSYKPCVTPLLA